MSGTYVIEAAEIGAGIVIRERAGFRFFAAAKPFVGLDGHIFKTVNAAQRAADRLVAGQSYASW
ncbi:MAG: hypothetical protein WDN69_11685 [Aliidongia sp.]